MREGDRQLWVLTVSVVEAGVVAVAAAVAVAAKELDRGEEQGRLWDRDRGGTLALDGHPALHLLGEVGYSSLRLS